MIVRLIIVISKDCFEAVAVNNAFSHGQTEFRDVSVTKARIALQCFPNGIERLPETLINELFPIGAGEPLKGPFT